METKETIQKGIPSVNLPTATQLQFVTREQVGELLAATLAQFKVDADLILSLLKDKVYYLHYKAKFKPEEAIIFAHSIQEAKTKSIDYCKRWQLKFISVRPFFMDLDRSPEDNNRLSGGLFAGANKT